MQIVNVMQDTQASQQKQIARPAPLGPTKQKEALLSAFRARPILQHSHLQALTRVIVHAVSAFQQVTLVESCLLKNVFVQSVLSITMVRNLVLTACRVQTTHILLLQAKMLVCANVFLVFNRSTQSRTLTFQFAPFALLVRSGRRQVAYSVQSIQAQQHLAL